VDLPAASTTALILSAMSAFYATQNAKSTDLRSDLQGK
jgi:hypothetical protein